jgi:glycosyltransferase involved in cell wall biosynthesis
MSQDSRTSDTRRALVFFPYLPYPVRDGAQARCTTVLQGLRALGYEVTLLVSEIARTDPPTAEDVRAAEAALGVTVRVHAPTPGDHSFVSGIGLVYGTAWEGFTPPSLYRTFRELAARLAPDVVLINYGYWATLAQSLEPAHTVRLVDMIDLVSLHVAMSHALAKVMPARPVDPAQVPLDVLQEDFFRRQHLAASTHEFAAYEAFDGTIAISPLEAALVQRHTSRTSVSHIPMTVEARDVPNSYDGAPVYVMSDTLLNQQGYAYFVERVLPRIRAIDASFSLRVVGTGCQAVLPAHGVELVGPVDSLADLYATARFAVCPLIGGTGQQVKVVEAMAHGVPVIALDDLADRSPVGHEVNGVRVSDAEGFAEACLRLWTNVDLARRLGGAARETVRRSFDPGRVAPLLAQAIERARHAARARMDGPEEPAGPLRRFLAAESDWALDGRRVAIYGAGSLGRRCRTQIAPRADVVAFVDSDRSKDGTSVEGLPVVSPERLDDFGLDMVIVASMYWPQILNRLNECGWDDDRVRVF